jgi:hypothetical protein
MAGFTPGIGNADELTATRHRVVLHGVDVDWNTGRIDADSQPVLDEAVQLLMDSRDALEVVVMTQPMSEFETPAGTCGASSVRNFLAEHGVSTARLMTVTVPPPQPSLLALASDGSAHCRVGFVVD